MARRAVTFCTDGNRDYVVTPEGVRYVLGPVSVLKIVAQLVPRAQARRVLDEFNETGEVMTVLDVDALFEMLAPVRRRFYAEGGSTPVLGPHDPLISAQDRVTTTKGATMAADDKAHATAIASQIVAIEQQIGALQRQASQDGCDKLRSLVAGLQDPMPSAPEAASCGALTENSNVAEGILSQVSETSEIVTKLASQGRRFNATQALADLHEISTRVAEILENVDLAQPWVQRDLNALATKAAHIHGLFSGAK